MTFLSRISIRQKLIFIILTVAFFAISIGFVAALMNNISNMKEMMVRNTLVNANLISEYCVTALTFGDTRSTEEYLKKLGNLQSIHNVVIYDENNHVFLTYALQDSIAPPEPPFKVNYQFESDYLHVFQPIVYRDIQYGHIYIRSSTENLSKQVKESLITLVVIMMLILFLSFILSMKLQAIISQPVHKLTEVVQQISNKPDYSFRIEKKRSDELGLLYDGFNHMLEQLHAREVERDRAESEIKASLREKEVMLKEIHHRVKNNMQVICSLLNLQSRYIDDSAALTVFKESQNRIRSMALIHEKLYRSHDLASINFSDYIETLVYELERSYGVNPNQIDLNVNVENVVLPIDQAVPFGLVINELVSNSIKHAFPESMNDNGQISINLIRNKQNTIHLTVKDNGVGMPEDVDFRNTSSLGLRLAVMLVEEQLSGSIELDRNSGTAFYIKI